MNLLVLKNFVYDPSTSIVVDWLLKLPTSVPILHVTDAVELQLILGQYDPDYVILLGHGDETKTYTIEELVVQGRPRKVLCLPEPGQADQERVQLALTRFNELLEIEYGKATEGP